MAQAFRTGTAKIAAGAPNAGNIPHGMLDNAGVAVQPNVLVFGQAGETPADGIITSTIVDATNLTFALAGNATTNVFINWMVGLTTLACETSNFDLKLATEPGLGISAPTGFVPVRTRILADQVAVPGAGLAIPLNVANTNAYIVAHLLDCPLEFSIDNPFVSGAFDDPAIPTTLTLISRTTANQVCNVTFRMHHSLTR